MTVPLSKVDIERGAKGCQLQNENSMVAVVNVRWRSLMPINVRVILSIVLLSILISGCATYSAKPITATVVDLETKQPLSDVIVVAHWELDGGFEGGNFAGNMMVMETITDDQGVFHFPAWGPLKKPKQRILEPRVQLKNYDPQIYLFKNGYRPRTLGNNHSLEQQRDDPSVRVSDWDGKVMPLKKYEGSLRDYASDEIGWLSSSLWRAMSASCTWTKLPLTILALQEQTKAFDAAGIDTGNFYTDLVANEEGFRKDGCSVADFLREHSK